MTTQKLNKRGDRRGMNPAFRRTKEGGKHRNFKVCTRCGDRKQLSLFALRGQAGDYKKAAADPTKYAAQCKKCKAAVSAKLYAKKKREGTLPKRFYNADAQRKYRKKVKSQTRIKVFQYLAEKGCCKCGHRDPRVLEFDHVDASKKISNIATMVKDGFSWASEKLRTEILKCRVICANCHRLHTIEQQDYYSSPEVQRELRRILDEHGIE